MEVSVHDDGRAGTKSPPTPPLTRAYSDVGLVTAQVSDRLSRSDPLPPTHTPTLLRTTVRTLQDISFTVRLSRTPLIDGGQCARLRTRRHKVASNSVARTYTTFRRSHVHYVPRVTPQFAPQCARPEN